MKGLLLALALIGMTFAQIPPVDNGDLIAVQQFKGLNAPLLDTLWPYGNSTTPCLTWVGIQCQVAENYSRIYQISLPGLQLRGIHNLIWSMPYLSYLDLSNNNFTGPLPTTITLGNLRGQLNTINLSNNRFNSTIPMALFNMTNLLHLMLNGNQFTGSIPSEISRMTALWSLNLANNKLSGTIPPQITTLIELDLLDFSYNQFTGSLPTNMRALSQLETFSISNNPGINGQIPEFTAGNMQLFDLNATGINANTLVPLFLKSYTKVAWLPSITWRCPIPACSEGVNCVLKNVNWPCNCPCDPTGGSCVEGTTACSCLGFRYGSTCGVSCPGYQVINQAQNQWVVCNGKGTCDSGSAATGRCSCDPSYRGLACETVCPGASNNTCNGVGVCGLDGTCTCQGNYASPDCTRCTDGWGGAGCVVQCPQALNSDEASVPCGGNGVCQQDATCVCYDNYEGADCASKKSQETVIWSSVAAVFIVLAILTVAGLALTIWCYRRSRQNYDVLSEQFKYLKEDGGRGEREADKGLNDGETEESRLPKREKQSIDLAVMSN